MVKMKKTFILYGFQILCLVCKFTVDGISLQLMFNSNCHLYFKLVLTYVGLRVNCWDLKTHVVLSAIFVIY